MVLIHAAALLILVTLFVFFQAHRCTWALGLEKFSMMCTQKTHLNVQWQLLVFLLHSLKVATRSIECFQFCLFSSRVIW